MSSSPNPPRATSPAASTDSSDGGGADPAPSPSPVRPSSTSSKRAYTTEVVKALFGGGSVGDVVQDFPCSFQRQSGRLYVSTNGLFFYSNLFGFEKKVRINYDQALDIVKIRTTSLSVTTAHGEFVFRSFDNRECVLDIILTYHPKGGETSNATIPEGAPSSEEVAPVAVGKSFEKTDRYDSAKTDGSPQGSPLADLSNKLPSSHFQNIDQKEKMEESKNTDDQKATRKTMKGDSVVAGSSENISGDTTNNAKQLENMMQHTKGWESILVNLKLSCKSVEDFFDSFLGNDAANSLKLFHGDFVGDKNISIETWKPDGEEEPANVVKSLSRTIQFEHNKSGAKVTRQQSYYTYGCHACLKNVTTIKGRGVPDVFFVEDAWFIVNDENDEGVVLSVKFHVNFTKGTMLRSIIEGRARAETKEWYRSYSSFARRRLQLKVPEQEEIIAPDVVDAAKTEGKWSALFWDWFGILASLAREQMPCLSTYMPASFERWKTQLTILMQGEVVPIALDWHRFLVSSALQCVQDLSTVSQNAPFLLLFVVSAIIIYRFKLRVTALEEIVGEIEIRLLELEMARIDAQSLTAELS